MSSLVSLMLEKHLYFGVRETMRNFQIHITGTECGGCGSYILLIQHTNRVLNILCRRFQKTKINCSNSS